MLEPAGSPSETPDFGNRHRRFFDGVGCPLGRRVNKRKMDYSLHKLPHQRPRDGDSASEPSSVIASNRSTCASFLRQHDGSSLSKKRRLSVPATQRLGSLHPHVSQEQVSFPFGEPHRGSDERSGRWPIKAEATGDRVEIGPTGIREDSLAHPSSPGRLVCDFGEPTTSGVCGTEPRPVGNSHGRILSGLELLEDNLPPQSQILKALNHLDHFRGTAYLVAPCWPARIWFPLLEAKSKSSFPFEASLSQRVGEESVYDSSSLHRSLHV